MAKETKNAAPAAKTATATTTENIYEQLDNASLGRKEQADKALEKIQKDHDEHTQNEMARRFEKASYRVELKLLNLRRERDIAKFAKVELVHVDRLSRLLMGFTVSEEIIKQSADVQDIFGKEDEPLETIDAKAKTITVLLSGEKKTFKVGEDVPPVIDYVDFDTLEKKIQPAIEKLTREVENTHLKYRKKLDAKYNRYWEHSWYY